MANSIFVSPGVYTSEKDLTFVTKNIGVTTLGLAGETTQGPAFNPIFISDYNEFQTFFGGLDPTIVKDNGALKYELPYIAKSYLSQSNQLYVTRVLGYSGYDAGKAWAITIDGAFDPSTTATTQTATPVTNLISFSGITSAGTVTSITTSDAIINQLFETGDLNFDTLISTSTGNSISYDITWTKLDNSLPTFDGVSFTQTVTTKGTNGIYTTGTTSGITTHYSATTYTDADNKVVALLRSRGAYDGNEILNFQLTGTNLTIDSTQTSALENPLGEFVLSANSITQGVKTYNISFDTTNKNYITRVLGRTQIDGITAPFVEEIYQNIFNSLLSQGKIRGINLTLVDYSTDFNKYKQQYSAAVSPWVVSEVRGSNIIELFRLWTISDGNTANSQIKVSIENIKPDAGEFDVTVRNYSDTDVKPVKLEGFSKCVMDPTADNFVGRKIGTTDGNFTSNSSYILVEIAEGNDLTNSFPAGFVGYPQRDYTLNGNTSIANPSLTYRTTYPINQPKRKFYLGLSDVIGFDQDFFNYKGESTTNDAWSGYTAGFHMDSGATICTIDGQSLNYTFEVGNGEFRTDAGIFNNDYSAINARKFTFAFAGGFDGWDIYRTRRTNTDAYSINGSKSVAYQITNGAQMALSNGETGLNSDYYAYYQAYRTFANPEDVNINVFASPGIDTTDNGELVTDTIEIMEIERADSIYIVTTPDTAADGTIMDEADVVGNLDGTFDSNYTATYFPWVQINDTENNQYVWIPPTRDVVTNIALTDNVAFPWFAVAGVSRGDVNCIKARKKLTQDNRDVLYDGRVNPVATFSTEGVKIWGNKTLQINDTALNRLNVRRLLLQTRKLIAAVSLNLLFDQADAVVANKFLNVVNPILSSIKSERGIIDFRITVDASPETLDQNTLNGTIWLKPTKSLEYINIGFNIVNGDASFDNI